MQERTINRIYSNIFKDVAFFYSYSNTKLIIQISSKILIEKALKLNLNKEKEK